MNILSSEEKKHLSNLTMLTIHQLQGWTPCHQSTKCKLHSILWRTKSYRSTMSELTSFDDRSRWWNLFIPWPSAPAAMIDLHFSKIKWIQASPHTGMMSSYALPYLTSSLECHLMATLSAQQGMCLDLISLIHAGLMTHARTGPALVRYLPIPG